MQETRLSVENLKRFAEALLGAGGFNTDESKIIAASLTLSEMMGYGSHGLMRIPEYLQDLKQGNTVSGTKMEVLKETQNSLTINAHRCAGQVVMPEVLEKLYIKLKTQAVVSAAVRYSGHVGRIGEWVERPAYAGYAALLLVSDNGAFLTVAPPGGKQSVTSTNPVAFAVPMMDGDIFLTDMSTSALAFGKIKLARLNGEQVPLDCIQNAEGHPTTDPEALFTKTPGSLLPMGGSQGYKGFALSMFVDLLTAGLTGGEAPPAPQGTLYANNVTLVLWNPEFFAGSEHMKEQAQKYIDFVHQSAPTDAAKPIRLPGDRLKRIKRENEQLGLLLQVGLVEKLLRLAKDLKVTPPQEWMR